MSLDKQTTAQLARRAALAILAATMAAACGGGDSPAPCPNTSCPSPHPLGWGSLHGAEARTASSCVRCHDQQGASVICVLCHRVGGSGVDPHLPAFIASHYLSDVPGNALAPLGGGVSAPCLACHPS